MDVSEVLDTLVAAGLIEEDGTTDDLSHTEKWRQLIASEQDRFSEAGTDAYVASLPVDSRHAARLETVADIDQPFLVRFGAVARETGSEFADILASVVVLDFVENGLPRSEGSPDAFLPVRGTQLRTAVRLLDRSFVYAWREDCPPCDAMREQLDELFETPPAGVTFLSVYGPDCARLLAEEFDVPGAPVIMSVVDGEVDARMFGPQHGPVIEREIETLQEMTPG